MEALYTVVIYAALPTVKSHKCMSYFVMTVSGAYPIVITPWLLLQTLHGQEVCGIRLKVMAADPRNDDRRKRLRMDDHDP
jgi:hypothetical protein